MRNLRIIGIYGLAAVLAAGLTVALAAGLALEKTHPALAGIVLGLFWLSAVMLAASALTAIAGLSRAGAHPAKSDRLGKSAVLWLLCGEDPAPIAARAAEFLAALDATGQGGDCDLFLLSDTQGPEAQAAERAAFAALGARVHYRNRPAPTGRKTGNLADWMARYGRNYDTFLLLDADSGFSAARLKSLRGQMAANPKLGLIQAAMRLRPAQSRLGAMQRLSARLSGPVFAKGLAQASGDAGNFWGHNALIRTAAFAQISPLPDLPGRPPFGGPILSHDFVEAAFLRRAGWGVHIDPDTRGSFEDAPDALSGYLRRDRRWAQGNLQHLRLIGAHGLHPVSRLHLGAGIMAYLMAPIWLLLVLLMGSGAVHAGAGAIGALVGILALLLVPKLAGVARMRGIWGKPWRRRIVLRALWAELAMTTVFAPLAMMHRTAFVVSVLAGRNAGWVPSGQAAPVQHAPGRVEQMGGMALLLCVALPQWGLAGRDFALLAATLVLPVALPLLAAPLLWRWFDATNARDAVARYYDKSTRRFLAIGGSGAALAIHRPLWAEGITSPDKAAAHINDLIAQAADDALGRAPARMVDLGCGVGGTLFHLAHLWPELEARGITISAEQVRIARELAQAKGLSDRCQFLRADFTQPTTLPPADLAIAVESHVHARDAESFLESALRHLVPGGVLIVVDDMLAREETALTARDAARVQQFRRGWRLGHVPVPDRLVAQAQSLGFVPVAVQDLTPLLRLDRWRDRALRAAGPVADLFGLDRSPLFGNMIGGNALTESYRAGVMRYTLIVLQKGAIARVEPVLNTTQQAVA